MRVLLPTVVSMTAHKANQAGLGVLEPVFTWICMTRIMANSMQTPLTPKTPASPIFCCLDICKVGRRLRGRAITVMIAVSNPAEST